MQKFKKADREKFMSDWRSCVPAMRQRKSMSLAKRNGPLIVGLYLQENRLNTSYIVIPYVHNLTRRTNSVSLTLSYPLRTKRNTYQDDFTVKSHDREFPEACKRLHKQTLFPLSSELSLQQILNAYERYISEGLLHDAPIFLYEDILSLLAWCGKLAEAKRRLGIYTKIMTGWDEWIFRNEGGRVAFFNRLVEIIEMPDKLEDICEEQVALLKVNKLPDYGFICD